MTMRRRECIPLNLEISRDLYTLAMVLIFLNLTPVLMPTILITTRYEKVILRVSNATVLITTRYEKVIFES